MLKRKRRIKRNRKLEKRQILLISSAGLLALLVVICIVLFVKHTGRLVSPLPRVGNMHITTDSANTAAMQKVEKALLLSKISVTDVKISTEAAILAQIQDNGVVIFSKNKGLTDQITSLQVILKQLTMEGKRFSRLDLRFDKPIIVLN